ncbi:MAG: CPXCG motif-containing cysteine-rich protein [Gammaproteobacteria bacterium]|jgi:hypothetical protein
MLEVHTVICPYCGESFSTDIDLSVGSQSYIEDCYVCCHPILFLIDVGYTGELNSIITRRDDD